MPAPVAYLWPEPHSSGNVEHGAVLAPIEYIPHDIVKLPDDRTKAAAQRREHKKASVRAKVEHLLRVIKRQLGLVKVRFRGLAKNNAHVVTLCALSNLWMARKQLMAMQAVVRPQAV